MSVQDSHFSVVLPERWESRGWPHEFDRVEFAMWVLRRLRPKLTVAVYRRARELSVEQGRDLGRGPSARWAMIGIPPTATREHIVTTLVQVAGAGDVPFLVDLLLGAGRAVGERPATG